MFSRAFISAVLFASSLLIVADDSCVPTLPGTYSLRALNTTRPNTSENGALIGVTALFSSQGFTIHDVTVSGASEFTALPTWRLINNGLDAEVDGEFKHHLVATHLFSNSVLQMSEDGHDQTAPNPLYCAITSAAAPSFNALVTKEVAPTNLWSICPGDRSWPVVVYNATASNWPMDQCYSVELLLVPNESA